MSALAVPDAALRRWLTFVLVLMVLDTCYLSWRFIALDAGWATPGTGLCSWSAAIDCDKVLMTDEAHAFVVPNAILGLGCYGALLLFWGVGQRLGRAHLRMVAHILTVALGITTLFTFYFWKLLLGLDALCPFCPWNHVLTYVALGLGWRLTRTIPRPQVTPPPAAVLALGAGCLGFFVLVHAAWFALG